MLFRSYISEVYGDGHYGFFTDSIGMVYLDAIEGLKAIGAEKYAGILEKAVSEFVPDSWKSNCRLSPLDLPLCRVR